MSVYVRDVLITSHVSPLSHLQLASGSIMSVSHGIINRHTRANTDWVEMRCEKLLPNFANFHTHMRAHMPSGPGSYK